MTGTQLLPLPYVIIVYLPCLASCRWCTSEQRRSPAADGLLTFVGPLCRPGEDPKPQALQGRRYSPICCLITLQVDFFVSEPHLLESGHPSGARHQWH